MNHSRDTWMAMKDSKGVVQWATPEGEQLTQMSVDEILGKTDYQMPWSPLAEQFEIHDNEVRSRPGEIITRTDISILGNGELALIEHWKQADDRGRIFMDARNVTSSHPSAEWFTRCRGDSLILPDGQVMEHDELMVAAFLCMGMRQEAIAIRINRTRSAVYHIVRQIKQKFDCDNLQLTLAKNGLGEMLLTAGKYFA